jgi:SAM-dependent methyltransferase
MSVLVTALRLRNRFLPGYASRLARTYETQRDSLRWRGEIEAFERLYERIQPATVLDCPVGTGRWLPYYAKSGASVLGVDFSEHMLAEAGKKVAASARCRLVQGDALDPAFFKSLADDFDLIVCTRFAHWLTRNDLATLIASFGETGARFMMIGARTTSRASNPRPGSDRSGLSGLGKRIRKRLHRSVVHVHDEEDFLGILQKNGWKLVAKEPIRAKLQSRYFFFLLESVQSP